MRIQVPGGGHCVVTFKMYLTHIWNPCIRPHRFDSVITKYNRYALKNFAKIHSINSKMGKNQQYTYTHVYDLACTHARTIGTRTDIHIHTCNLPGFTQVIHAHPKPESQLSINSLAFSISISPKINRKIKSSNIWQRSEDVLLWTKVNSGKMVYDRVSVCERVLRRRTNELVIQNRHT